MHAKNAVWIPSQKIIQDANITAFMKRHEIKTYEELIRRTTTGIEWFWDSCVHETGISWFEPYTVLLEASAGIAKARWFLGGQINMAANLVDRHARDKKTTSKIAVQWQGECGANVELTYQQLFDESNRVANYLQSIGIGRGDAVGLYLPMLPELIPVFLGILKVGAVVVPVFSGFAAEAVLARFHHARVKAIFTADGTLRKGKAVLLKKLLEEVLPKIPSLKSCVVVKRLHEKNIPMRAGRDFFYDEVVSLASSQNLTEALPSEHPSMIIYTSGTTGNPKGTVHTHAGTLAQVTKELFFNFDLKPCDIFFWVTDIGWMMGPWEIIGTLHFGATLVIMEGAPVHPRIDRVLEICKNWGVTHLGLSPTLVRLWRRDGSKECEAAELLKLRMFGSTGEPWDEDSYLWLFEKIGKKKLPIMNISGGTEIMGCLLAPLPIQELTPCSLQSPGLGMAVDVFNEAGYSAAAGEVGYLVCKKPAPSMCKTFLHEPERYQETYFSKFKNVWNHGDWAVHDIDGHWYLRGRADDTIKVAGKRTGPAEIETALCDHPFVNEACAIGVPDELKGEDVVCFVRLRKGVGMTEFLQKDLRLWVADKLGKTLTPRLVYAVEALPKTRSGKIVRGAIKKHYLRQGPIDTTSLENPDSLKMIPRPGK